MNYRLSCAADRTVNKCGFTLECCGKEVYSELFKCISDNLKECILETIYRGIRVSRGYVSHDDIIRIEIQNNQICEWLSGYKEYKGYTDYINKIFEVLESMDCRYTFVYVKKPYAKLYIASHDLSKVNVSSVADIMKDFN